MFFCNLKQGNRSNFCTWKYKPVRSNFRFLFFRISTKRPVERIWFSLCTLSFLKPKKLNMPSSKLSCAATYVQQFHQLPSRLNVSYFNEEKLKSAALDRTGSGQLVFQELFWSYCWFVAESVQRGGEEGSGSLSVRPDAPNHRNRLRQGGGQGAEWRKKQ